MISRAKEKMVDPALQEEHPFREKSPVITVEVPGKC
jgi:hypothetical protein